MASTASLLFNIKANSDDAESTIKSFRELMGKNVSDLGGEFDDWSKDVLGDLTTVSGAMTAVAGVAGAAVMAVGGFMAEQTSKYMEYVGEVDHAMRVTGQSAETMSTLHLAADDSLVSFDLLTQGVTHLESSMFLAQTGSVQTERAFQKLGITQEDLKNGEKDLTPFLAKAMDGFKNMASATDRAAVARQLFSRSGVELLPFLIQGSGALKEFEEKASSLGVKLNQGAIDAFHKLKAAEKVQEATLEALAVTVGGTLLPVLTKALTVLAALTKAAMDKNPFGPASYLMNVRKEYIAVTAEIQKQTEALGYHSKAAAAGLDGGDGTGKQLSDYRGISSILDELRTKVASYGSEEERMTVEMDKYSGSVTKAKAELAKMEKEGTITAESARRESAKLALIPDMLAQVWQDFYLKQAAAAQAAADKQTAAAKAAADKQAADAVAAAHAQLEAINQLKEKLRTATAGGSGNSFEDQREALAESNEAMRESYLQKGAITQQMEDLLLSIYRAGLAKIDAAEKAAGDKANAAAQAAAAKKEQQFQEEINRLQEHNLQIVSQHASAQEKLKLQYEKDLDEYSLVEQQKVTLTMTDEAEIAAVEKQFAANRASITQKYQQDLQTLRNSQGFQGVFGSQFQAALQGDEQLMKQWQTSSNQSLMLVSAALRQMKLDGQQAFQQMAQGMAAGIVNALEYGKSIDAAMKQAAKATLESIAQQAVLQAIYSAAWGFYDIATGNYPGAVAAFEAAALFGAVGVGAALGASAIGGGSGSSASGSSASAPGASGSRSGGGAAGTAGAGGAGQGKTVNVTVNGHIIGVNGSQQLADIINQGVYNNDVTLYASHNAQGVPLS